MPRVALSDEFVSELGVSALGDDVRAGCARGAAARAARVHPAARVPPAARATPAPSSAPAPPTAARERAPRLARGGIARKLDAVVKIQASFRRYLLSPHPVSVALAAERFRRSLPRTPDGELLRWLPPRLSTDFALAEGVGTALALRFELEMGLLLAAMFACSLFALGHNIQGGVLEPPERFRVPVTGAVGSLGNAASLDDVRGLSEGAGTMLLALALVVMRRVYGEWTRAVEERLTTVADYTVELRGLPAAATASDMARALRARLPGARIVGVTLALDEGALLAAMAACARAHRALREKTRALLELRERGGAAGGERAAVSRERHALAERAAELDGECARLRAVRLPCVGVGFAVFNLASDAQRAIAHGALECAAVRADAKAGARVAEAKAEAEVEAEADVGGGRLPERWVMRVQRAPEPSDVLWANLPLRSEERARRRLVAVGTSLVVILTGAIVMGVGRGSTGRPIFGVGCIIFGNALINASLPRIALREGWQRVTQLHDSLCAKLAAFQILNSVAALLVWLGNTDGRLSAEWWRECAPIVNAIIVSQIGVSNVFALLRLGSRVRRWFRAPRARTQADANSLWAAKDESFVPVRTSLVLKYAALALMLGPLFPTVYLLGAAGCAISFAIDAYLLLRQLAPLPHTDGRLILTTALERVLPCALVARVPVALVALAVRSRQLALQLPAVDGCALDPAGARGGADAGGPLAAALDVLRAPAPCNSALLWAMAGSAGALLVLGLGLSMQRDRDAHDARARAATEPPLLGGVIAVPGADGRPVSADCAAHAGLGLYLSPTQQRVLRELAAERGEDPLSERAAFTGESIALSLEVALRHV
ncbi:hypothetical protein KFE25_012541 [Diacronema lutheri]|uniref:CSC1/OSCA1-like cytosolic domain-containing protein n=3 Tax=Diacronema lutheri TaxID=2081491 RepID=A0A8J5XIM7_DIALT|nr:hypothetical protein KFE25_012541 [Diacronema lutheri]